MKPLAKRLANFPEYIHAILERKAKEVEKRSGRPVLNFGPGTPDVLPSKAYIEKLQEYIAQGDAHLYPGFGASKEFIGGIQHWHKERFRIELESEEIYPLLGGKDGIAHIALALFDEGDEVLIPDPGYPSYEGTIRLALAEPKGYDANGLINIEELEKKYSPKTKALWVNFPSNPTGQVATKKDLEPLVAFAKARNLWLLYDNAYAETTYGGFVAPSILEIEGAKTIAIEIGSFSKTFSFAGYRMGWIVGNNKLIAAVAKTKSQIDSGMFLPLQRLGGFALKQFDKEWHKKALKAYEQRRDILLEKIKGIGLEAQAPKGALYLWARIPKGYKNSEEFTYDMLEKKQVLFTPGNAFGKNGKDYVRISFCVNIDSVDDYL